MTQSAPSDDIEDIEGFYERDANRHNIWRTSHRTNLYFKEMLRYERLMQVVPRSARRVLDAGCGDGLMSVMLARRGHAVTALDLSRGRLDKFADQAEEYGITQVQGSIADTGLPAESFDVVVLSEVVEHLPGPAAALAEARRLLCPGGTLIVSVPNLEQLGHVVCPHCKKPFNTDGHLHSFSADSLSDTLRAAGFDPVETMTFRNYRAEKLRGGLVNLPYGAWIRGIDRLFSRWWPELNRFLAVSARKPQ